MLEPGDVRMLPYGEQLVFVTGTKPFWTKKIGYYEEPLFKARATNIRAGGSGPSQGGGLSVPQKRVVHDWVGVPSENDNRHAYSADYHCNTIQTGNG
jgi:type IV secretory pathway TraG/TraD family ATPase VirD4